MSDLSTGYSITSLLRVSFFSEMLTVIILCVCNCICVYTCTWADAYSHVSTYMWRPKDNLGHSKRSMSFVLLILEGERVSNYARSW